MTRINVTTRSGAEQAVDGADGISLMEVMRANGIEDILALCGGCCSCATCHVYVDEAHTDLLPPMSEVENDLLDGSLFRTDRSRLSCQIPCSAVLQGIRLQVAPED